MGTNAGFWFLSGERRGNAGSHLGKIIMSTSPVVDKAPPMVSGTQMNGFLIACT